MLLYLPLHRCSGGRAGCVGGSGEIAAGRRRVQGQVGRGGTWGLDAREGRASRVEEEASDQKFT